MTRPADGGTSVRLICRGCGGTVEGDCEPNPESCLDPRSVHGWSVDHTQVIFHGWCRDCRADRTP